MEKLHKQFNNIVGFSHQDRYVENFHQSLMKAFPKLEQLSVFMNLLPVHQQNNGLSNVSVVGNSLEMFLQHGADESLITLELHDITYIVSGSVRRMFTKYYIH